MVIQRERSSAYPVLELAEAVQIVRDDLRGLGTEAEDRDALARRLKYQSGAGGLAARKIGALVHYGQLARSFGLYRLTLLAARIQTLEPEEAEFRLTVQAAFEHPSLFRRILSRFRPEGRLPPDLPACLASSFGITEKASPEAADIFIESAQFAGVLTPDGRFVLLPAKPGVSSTRQAGERSDDSTVFTWPLPDLRSASLEIPREVTAQDGELLERQLRAKAERLGELLGTGAAVGPEDSTQALRMRLYLANRRDAVFVVPLGLTRRDCDVLKEEVDFFCSNWPALLGVAGADVGVPDSRQSRIGPRGLVR